MISLRWLYQRILFYHFSFEEYRFIQQNLALTQILETLECTWVAIKYISNTVSTSSTFAIHEKLRKLSACVSPTCTHVQQHSFDVKQIANKFR